MKKLIRVRNVGGKCINETEVDDRDLNFERHGGFLKKTELQLLNEINNVDGRTEIDEVQFVLQKDNPDIVEYNALVVTKDELTIEESDRLAEVIFSFFRIKPRLSQEDGYDWRYNSDDVRLYRRWMDTLSQVTEITLNNHRATLACPNFILKMFALYHSHLCNVGEFDPAKFYGCKAAVLPNIWNKISILLKEDRAFIQNSMDVLGLQAIKIASDDLQQDKDTFFREAFDRTMNNRNYFFDDRTAQTIYHRNYSLHSLLKQLNEFEDSSLLQDHSFLSQIVVFYRGNLNIINYKLLNEPMDFTLEVLKDVNETGNRKAINKVLETIPSQLLENPDFINRAASMELPRIDPNKLKFERIVNDFSCGLFYSCIKPNLEYLSRLTNMTTERNYRPARP